MIQYGCYQWPTQNFSLVQNRQTQSLTSQSLAMMLGRALKQNLTHFSNNGKKDKKADISTENESKEANNSSPQSSPLKSVEEIEQPLKQVQEKAEKNGNKEEFSNLR